jgi:hypothetical protein
MRTPFALLATSLTRLSASALSLALLLALPTALAAKGVPSGRYECWFYNTPQPLKNFTLKRGTYIDASGASGSVTVAGNKLTFKGGTLDGRTGIYNGGSPPTISFYNADGEEVLLCQRTRWSKP